MATLGGELSGELSGEDSALMADPSDSLPDRLQASAAVAHIVHASI